MSRTLLPYGDHHVFTLGYDDLDALQVDAGEHRDSPYHILHVPGHGYVLNVYPSPYAGDYQSVDGYFDSADQARAYLRTLETVLNISPAAQEARRALQEGLAKIPASQLLRSGVVTDEEFEEAARHKYPETPHDA